ncbi:uncharacterized protein LOC131951131 [Physella acuta]|uniref:uncharacterized protein LOC131951131 n=1 Tax=Physella acuta TaxID=109671 RepID=UPI0027DB7211|nr:uncharacterized protein LOC131951131 [Physella acuta]
MSAGGPWIPLLVPGLFSPVWDTTLAEFAEDWTSRCEFEHSNQQYGENLYQNGPLDDNATYLAYRSAASWLKELEYVDDDWECIAQDSPTCGHYSQMVWRDSVSVGCAITQCEENEEMPNLVSCNYDPPGNHGGQQPY